MPRAHPEYAITLAILGILVAIGIPAIRRGQVIVGAICIAVIFVIAGRAVLESIRKR